MSLDKTRAWGQLKVDPNHWFLDQFFSTNMITKWSGDWSCIILIKCNPFPIYLFCSYLPGDDDLKRDISSSSSSPPLHLSLSKLTLQQIRRKICKISLFSVDAIASSFWGKQNSSYGRRGTNVERELLTWWLQSIDKLIHWRLDALHAVIKDKL